MGAGIGLIAVWIVACIGVALIASAKGRSGMLAFWLSFFLSPLLGLVLIFATKSAEQRVREEGEYGDLKKCPKCAETIRREAIKCRYCGSEFGVQVVGGEGYREIDWLKAPPPPPDSKKGGGVQS